MIGQDSYIPYSEDNESFDAYEVSNIKEQIPDSIKSLKGENTYNNFDTSNIMYAYKTDSPEEAVKNVQKYAGRLNGGDFQWNFDNSVDDESDSVNKELKQALENYESQLLSVGGNSIEVPEGPVTEPEEPEQPEIINVESVTLNTEQEELKIGEKLTLVATVKPADATNKNVNWSTENADIANVDDNGVVTAIAEGTTKITVTTEDGEKSAICTITVKSDEVIVPDPEPEEPEEPDPEEPEQPEIINVDSVTLNTNQEKLKIGEKLTLVATINPADATNKNVRWSTENADIANVDDNGVVTAIAEGTTEITVTTEDGSKEAKCLIVVTQQIEEMIATISYDNMQPTNQNVTAKITFNKDDITIINNDGKDEYIFEKNGEFTFEYQDSQGNISQSTAKVNWIDKDVPEISIEYQTINDGEAVNVIIQSNEELVEIPGWTLSENRKSISKVFYENTTETIELSDIVGNASETTIKIDNINENQESGEDDKQNNINTNTSNPANKIDNTVSNMILPSAGIPTILKAITFILVIAMIGFYIRYKNLKNVIK